MSGLRRLRPTAEAPFWTDGNEIGVAVTHDNLPSDGYRIQVGGGEEVVTLRIEPVNQFEIPAGEEFTIQITGPSDETIEVTHSRGYVEVWPSPKLFLIVRDGDGKQLDLL